LRVYGIKLDASNLKEMLVNKPLLLTTGALMFGALSVATPDRASADVRVRLGGGVTVRTHVRPVYRPAYRPVYRPYYRPNYAVGGSIWIGGGTYYNGYYGTGYRTYAAPPPAPSCNCGPGAVPSYYPGYYSQPAGHTTATAVAPEQRELPRLAVGGFAGGFDVDGEGGSDIGILARLRLTDGLLIEGEYGASELEHSNSDKPDQRFGGSLIYEFGARNTWAPYVVGGLGATVNRDTEDSRSFGEIGVGLRWALSDNLHLAFDLRAGAQELDDSDYAARVVLPTDDDDETVEYTRGRLSAMLYF
jgi:Outer membrane protein beta-barrel domain